MLLIHLFIFQTNVYTRHYAFPFIPYPFYSIPFYYVLNISNTRASPLFPFLPRSTTYGIYHTQQTKQTAIYCMPYFLHICVLQGFSFPPSLFYPCPVYALFCIFMCPFIHHFVHHSFFFGGFINSCQPFLCISSKIRFLTSSLYPCPIWSRYLPNFSLSSSVNPSFLCIICSLLYFAFALFLASLIPILYNPYSYTSIFNISTLGHVYLLVLNFPVICISIHLAMCYIIIRRGP